MATTRLEAARAEARAAIDNLAPDRRAALDRALAIDGFAEHAAYHAIQSRAFAVGRIPIDAARFLYTALGETGSADNGYWAAGTSTADKAVATRAIGELLEADIALAGIGGRR